MDEEFDFESRIEHLRSLTAAEEVDSLLIVDPLNIRYLSGFSGGEGFLFVDGESATLVVDGRYTKQARGEVQGTRVLEYADKVEGVLEVILSGDRRKIGFEAGAVTYELFTKISDGMPDSSRLVPLKKSPAVLRACKDAGELVRMKEAAKIATRALRKTFETLTEGTLEREFALLLNWHMALEGSEKPSFDTIVASGANGALPHARPGSRPFKRGDFIVIDYGAVFEGYHSDETYTACLGRATTEQRRVYETVLAAHDRALEAVRPGVLCRELDGIARTYIEQAGFGSYFVHGTGHGVGLDVHEVPTMSPRSEDRLEEGMIITIEPGIYLPDRFGVRIEDMILVTGDGFEVLSETPKNFVEL
ncbi:MAG TPA: aminopeptidase P family protein [Deltaproteobacteria bacterium]|nr:aminopeptidase P family protein [Deltaproteobacteria bacterium]